MKPRGRDYLAAADILRVTSIFLIGWNHFWQQSWLDPGFRVLDYYVNLQNIVRHGYLMVDVIIVISGFLLSLPYARAGMGLSEHPDFHEFYVKRFWRIFPSYTLAVLLCLLLWAAPQGEYRTVGFMLKDVFTHLTFTHNLFYDTYFTTPLPIVLWTMGVEVQFYFLFPLIARLYERHAGFTCVLLALIAAVFRLAVYGLEDTTFWVNQLPAMLDLYACGLAGGYLYVRVRERELPGWLQWALAGIAFAALLILLQLLYLGVIGDYPELRRQQLRLRLPIGVTAAVFLVCGSLGPEKLSKALGNPVTRFFAAISYNFYIWHQFLAVRMKVAHIPPYTAEQPNQAGEQPWMTQYTLLCFAVAVAAAAIFTYLWEKPVYRWGTKRLLTPKTEETQASG